MATAVMAVCAVVSVGVGIYQTVKSNKNAREAASAAQNRANKSQAQLDADKAAVTAAAEEYAKANNIAVENMRLYDQALTDNIDEAIAQYETSIADLQKDFGLSMDEAQAAYQKAATSISANAYTDSKEAIQAMSAAIAQEASQYDSFVQKTAGATKAEIQSVIDTYAMKQGATIASMTSTMSAANAQLATDCANYMNDYQQKLDELSANAASQTALVQEAYKSAIDDRENKVSNFVNVFSSQAGALNADTQAAIAGVVDKYAADTGSISKGLAESLNALNESMSAKGEEITANLKTAIDTGNQALEAANAELGTAAQQVGAQANLAAGQSAVISEAAGQQAGNAAQQAARQSGMAGQGAALMGATEGARATREAFMGALEANRAAAQQAQQTRLQAQQLAAKTGMDQAQALAALEEAQRTGDFSQISQNLTTGAQTQLDTSKNIADMQTAQMRADQQAELDRMREAFTANVGNANQTGADSIHAADQLQAANEKETARQSSMEQALYQSQLEQARKEQEAAFNKAKEEYQAETHAQDEIKNNSIVNIQDAANMAIGGKREAMQQNTEASKLASQQTLQAVKDRSDKDTAANNNTLASETDQAKTALTAGMGGAATTAGMKIGAAATEHEAKTGTELQSLEGEKAKMDAAKTNAGIQAGVAMNDANNMQSANNTKTQAASQLGSSLISAGASLGTAAAGMM